MTDEVEGLIDERGDIVRVFHFVGARKRHYMYKQCLGLKTYPGGTTAHMFFSHLNFRNIVGQDDGPYHERVGQTLNGYEIIQSIKCDHEDRARKPLGETPGRAALKDNP